MINGDPKTIVDQLIASGQINQKQYNDAVSMANQMRMMMGMK